MISIVIAEDQRMLRGALGALLDMEDDMKVIGQAGNGEEALQLIDTLQPDVCIMDIEMPIQSGLDVAEQLQEQNSSCKIIILTTFARPGYFERAMKAGVYGYLLKDSPSEELAQSIRNVVSGRREISPELMMGLFRQGNPLTDRDKEILLLSKEGKTTNEIAKRLYLSPGTVRNYISDILNKLQARNRMEAITIAEEKGWM